MEKKRIITLSGMPGCGKSSTANLVAEHLGWRRFSSGDFLRQAAARHNMTIEEFNRHAETDPSFDHEVDQMLRDAGSQDELVIDSRLAFHWIPDSFKVFLKVDPANAARRAFIQLRGEGRENETAASEMEMRESLAVRTESEQKRYATLYGVDYTDETQFDLVIDTTTHDLPTVAAMVVEKYGEWKVEGGG